MGVWPGEFILGRWGLLVNVLALAYGVGAMVNISWPRAPEAAWYDNIVLLSGGVVVAIGVIYMFTAHHYGRSNAPAGDAVPARRPTADQPFEPGRWHVHRNHRCCWVGRPMAILSRT
ncbi:hypothetical protein [Saccharopolyspora pogona]|uniref:hypothetical protein n=1 Tax=Saccharopolyspora pogona TaxID=333966 RepID=UPI001CC257A6|nr:hypothetical protein [Saccharopolyspora pogona]